MRYNTVTAAIAKSTAGIVVLAAAFGVLIQTSAPITAAHHVTADAGTTSTANPVVPGSTGWDAPTV
jgi:hypothetical protein